MAQNGVEIFDSQIVSESVAFLDNCFDNSFTLQCSIIAAKEYISENTEKLTVADSKNSSRLKKTVHEQSIWLENSVVLSNKETDNCVSRYIKDWGLPTEIANKYEQKGIIKMFDWQVECLSKSKVLHDGSNLVYSAPTSAGKTLVAEILLIKTILERQKKVILILPFVSIVREKMFYLQDILSTSGIRVEGFMGSQSPPGGLQSVHVAICTIEKANSLVNKLFDEGSIADLGAVIVDELHLLGDPHRGYILELLLTKIKYVSSKSNDSQIQIVGMSATLPNLDVLANWLDAELFITQFRPVSLDEYLLVGNKYYDKHGKECNHLKKLSAGLIDSDSVLEICLDTIKEGCSVLIFCLTKNRCENVAQSLASSFFKLGGSGSDQGVMLRQQLNVENIMEVLEQLKNCPVGLDQVLKNTVSFGVAYHHAGLTFDERDIVEGGFKSGAIRVLVATSTLSSGVNLPARKVIIRSPVFQKQPINIQTYKQMVGRAGRMGKDVMGESILICTEAEKKIGFDLMKGTLDAVNSCIESEDKFMRAILEMITSQVASTKTNLEKYCHCTLLFNQDHVSMSQETLLQTTLDSLQDYELIRVQNDDDQMCYVATPLGKACLSSSMAPNDGLSLFCELQKARQCLVLETDLHLIYLVTPYSVSCQWANIDWIHMLSLWESLNKAMKRVGELVGVQESFIIRCLRGTSKLNNVQSKVNIHKRFYTALALQDLVNEVPLSDVAGKFQCARGFLQSLQQSAATFAGMVTAFCHQLGWKNLELLISQFQDRLHFGIHSELLELMKLPSLNGMRARTLFNAGFESITSIASADSNAIENALLKSVPFQSNKEGDDKDDFKKCKKMKSIWITGYSGMTTKEAADNLILEARKYLELEIGIAEIMWDKINSGPKIGNLDKKTTTNDQISNQSTLNKSNDTNHHNENETKSQNNNNEKALDDHVSNQANLCILHTDNELLQEIVKSSSDRTLINKNNINNEKLDFKQDGKSNKTIKNYNESNRENAPKDGKTSQCNKNGDEIIWDSLNFTEVVLCNVSKFRSMTITSSPNISFGEIDDRIRENEAFITKNSTKDISLFSSEGDNSSLFEESLPLDCVPSKLLDDKEIKITKIDEQDFLNTESILNVFKSSIIELEDDEDIKLVYEDEHTVSQAQINEKHVPAKTNHVNKIEIPCNPFKSPLKRQADTHFQKDTAIPLRKKIKTRFRQPCKSNIVIPIVQSKESEIFTLKIAAQKVSCYVLRDCDVMNNLGILNGVYEASIYLKFRKYTEEPFNQIGCNQVKTLKEYSCNLNGQVPPIAGMSIYDGHDSCIYFDFTGMFNSLLKDSLINWFKKKDTVLKLLSLSKDQNEVRNYLGVELPCSFDASLAEWLLNSDEKIPNLIYLCKKYCGFDMISDTRLHHGNEVKRYKDFNDFEQVCVKAYSLWRVTDTLQKQLSEHYLGISNPLDIEIKVSMILANCEYFGVHVDKELASKLLIDVRISQETLQKHAYRICGYHFNFNSSKDVAKVLGIYRGRKVSTKKSILEAHNSPMSSIVIYWRKLNSILTKTLYPLTERAFVNSERNRIYPAYTMFTCTGRISMHEPNLQNVPRTFSIPAKYLSLDIKDTNEDLIEFNCRNVFKAAPGCVLVSADYCQLEMRILTHYSNDLVLTRIMNSNVDVFRSIAASWGGICEEKVDDDLRQKAKQLCYGIIYGMGNKTLGHVLDVSEMEAAVFMDTFYKTYPTIRKFTETVIDECRKRGFVETLMKRRRYLPDITSCISSKKSAAERQAVNTTIQGSAADIAKAAMCAIDAASECITPKPKLILQMHDELIYEVPEHSKQRFVGIIKKEMEGTVSLKVPLPVKVKTGPTWGTLQEVLL